MGRETCDSSEPSWCGVCPFFANWKPLLMLLFISLRQQPVAREQSKKYFVLYSIENNSICSPCQLFNWDFQDKVEVFSNFAQYLRRKHLPEYEETFKNKRQSWKQNLGSRPSKKSLKKYTLCLASIDRNNKDMI